MALLGGVLRSLFGWLAATGAQLKELDWGELLKTVALAALTGTPVALVTGWSPETGVVVGWAGAEAANKLIKFAGVKLQMGGE